MMEPCGQKALAGCGGELVCFVEARITKRDSSLFAAAAHNRAGLCRPRQTWLASDDSLVGRSSRGAGDRPGKPDLFHARRTYTSFPWRALGNNNADAPSRQAKIANFIETMIMPSLLTAIIFVASHTRRRQV